MAPAAVFSQVESSQGDQELETRPAASGSSTGSGPWQNSAGSSVGTRDNNNTNAAGGNTGTNGNTNGKDPRLGPGGGTMARGGATTDGRDPGGNPDVPFDDNMNLLFLAAGLVFAGVVAGKRWKVKPVAIRTIK